MPFPPPSLGTPKAPERPAPSEETLVCPAPSPPLWVPKRSATDLLAGISALELSGDTTEQVSFQDSNAAARQEEATAAAEEETSPIKVSARDFYEEYHGHRLKHLETLRTLIAKDQPVVWLAGDSSLDNKFWLIRDAVPSERYRDNAIVSPALNGYERFLTPPRMVRDVAYWMNRLYASSSSPNPEYVVINAAVEESAISDRPAGGRLIPHDEFVRDHIAERDVLVVSVGGNDVALKPTPATVLAMASLMAITPSYVIDKHSSFAPGLAHFVRLFGSELQDYISRVLARVRPRLVLVCMIYYPAELNPGVWDGGAAGWAERPLQMLQYNSQPAKLQLLIRKVFDLATRRIKIDGTRVKAVPLFEVLDPCDPSDYVDRVEPSVQGGRKMAKAFFDAIKDSDDNEGLALSGHRERAGSAAFPAPTAIAAALPQVLGGEIRLLSRRLFTSVRASFHLSLVVADYSKGTTEGVVDRAWNGGSNGRFVLYAHKHLGDTCYLLV